MRASLLAGLGALRGNPLRTALATLGVVIGVGALVAVLAVGDGVERFARDEIARTTDLLMIMVSPRTSRLVDGLRVPLADYPRLSLADARAARDAVPGVALAVLSSSVPALVGAPGDTARRGMEVTGTLPEAAGELTLVAGRFFSDRELVDSARVVVLPAVLARALGRSVGDSVTVGGTLFTIVGLADTGASARRYRGYVPLSAIGAAALPPVTPTPTLLAVQVARVEDVPAARRRLESWLAARWGDGWRDRFSVATNELRVAQTRRAMLVFKLLMGAITGISLVVGGIGIMNVLLASVTERTREIGVRRATGARRKDILMQFLAESVTITGMGSAVGVMLGLATAFAVTAVMRARTEAAVRAAFTPATLAVAALAAIVVGLVFGIYPALRAARLPPIEAIRHE